MLKEFKPKNTPPADRETISLLFQKGDFHSAPQACRKAGYQIIEFQSDIEIGARKMLMSHRTGELLSFIHKYGIKVQYEIPILLKAVFEARDHHGFLKNAHRFKIYKGLETEIEKSISFLLEKGQKADAEGWQRKFESLRREKP